MICSIGLIVYSPLLQVVAAGGDRAVLQRKRCHSKSSILKATNVNSPGTPFRVFSYSPDLSAPFDKKVVYMQLITESFHDQVDRVPFGYAAQIDCNGAVLFPKKAGAEMNFFPTDGVEGGFGQFALFKGCSPISLQRLYGGVESPL